MIFHSLTMDDRERLEQAFREEGKNACDFSFANNYLWNRVYQIQVAESHGCVVLRYVEPTGIMYVFPIGDGDKRAAVQDMLGHTTEDGCKLCLTGLQKNEIQDLKRWFPGEFSWEEDRDNFDYLYLTCDLTKLSGKKFHGKRNHIARFKDLDWGYETISPDNVGECQSMLLQWKQKRQEVDDWDALTEEEYLVVEEALQLYEGLGLVGGLVRQEGTVVAFCLGEPITEDTFVVHFEKAFAEIQGAYAMINQQFVMNECQDYLYINREEDGGEPGLRKAKLSYHPVKLLEKYKAVER